MGAAAAAHMMLIAIAVVMNFQIARSAIALRLLQTQPFDCGLQAFKPSIPDTLSD